MSEAEDFEFQLRAEREFSGRSNEEVREKGDGTRTYVDPSDGTVYEWDEDKQGWFPKVSLLLIMRTKRLAQL